MHCIVVDDEDDVFRCTYCFGFSGMLWSPPSGLNHPSSSLAFFRVFVSCRESDMRLRKNPWLLIITGGDRSLREYKDWIWQSEDLGENSEMRFVRTWRALKRERFRFVRICKMKMKFLGIIVCKKNVCRMNEFIPILCYKMHIKFNSNFLENEEVCWM